MVWADWTWLTRRAGRADSGGVRHVVCKRIQLAVHYHGPVAFTILQVQQSLAVPKADRASCLGRKRRRFGGYGEISFVFALCGQSRSAGQDTAGPLMPGCAAPGNKRQGHWRRIAHGGEGQGPLRMAAQDEQDKAPDPALRRMGRRRGHADPGADGTAAGGILPQGTTAVCKKRRARGMGAAVGSGSGGGDQDAGARP